MDDSIYMQCLNKANLQKQKAHQWLPTAKVRAGTNLQTAQRKLWVMKMF